MMPKLNRRQRMLVRLALTIAQEDGRIFEEDYAADLGDHPRENVTAEIEEILRKLEFQT